METDRKQLCPLCRKKRPQRHFNLAHIRSYHDPPEFVCNRCIRSENLKVAGSGGNQLGKYSPDIPSHLIKSPS